MISVLCPSRSRPDLALRMVTSVLQNPGCPIEVILYLNSDDPLLEKYKEYFNPSQYIIGPDQSTSYSWNLMAKRAKYDILFLIGDDTFVETDNWGQLVVGVFDQYADKIVMVAPKAGTLGKYKCPHFFLHKNWVNVLGYFLPPHFYHHYVDHWIRDIAVSLKRFVHLPEFVMPIINNVNDEVINKYNQSWLKEKDTWMWEVTGRYKEADIQALAAHLKQVR